ncbi:MAG TPA: HD domain-containing protein [Candidatus Sulfotelmatobacter sp.]|nr:HD domain-containing protein [Candidatus Sulfotelmatobacter sp.]
MTPTAKKKTKAPNALKKPKVVPLGKRFLRAFEFAAKKHAGQGRKTTSIPYIAHLMGVTSLVLEAGGDEDLAIAALLHDVVEDCGGAPMLKEVRRRFGKRVAKIVDGCTDADTYPKPPWRDRKERYIARLKGEDSETRLVSAADKLNNVRSILADYRAMGEFIWQRFNGGREGTLWYYRTLRDEFLREPGNRVTRDLDLAVGELDSLVEAASRERNSSSIGA